MRKLLLIAAAVSVLATPALAARNNTCIRQDDIRNWTAINDKQVILENYRHQKVLLKLIGTCQNLRWREAIEIRSPGASRLSCVSRGDTIITRGFGGGGGVGAGRCAIVGIEPYNGPMNPRRANASDRHGDHDNDDDLGGRDNRDNNRGGY